MKKDESSFEGGESEDDEGSDEDEDDGDERQRRTLLFGSDLVWLSSTV